jgi:PKD repeat protein
VIDEGGKEDTEDVLIRVGNSNPIARVMAEPLRGSAPLEVEFDASGSSDPDSDELTVTWDFGDEGSPNNTITGEVVTHTYTNTEADVYTATATVTDGHGGEDKASVTITVIANQPPTASFTVVPSRGFAGREFTFDATGSSDPDGEIVSYRWNFGDEHTATGPEKVVTHTYVEEGIYQVKLTVTDNSNKSDTMTRQVIVEPDPGNRSPTAHIATLPTSCTVPCPLTLDGSLSFDPDGDDLEYRWEFTRDGVLTDTIARPEPLLQREFETPGEWGIALQVLDGRGGVDRTEPETILRVLPNGPTEPPPGRPDVPDDGDEDIPPNSAFQRPAGQLCGSCGSGMVMSLFGSLLGLWAMAAVRRREP